MREGSREHFTYNFLRGLAKLRQILPNREEKERVQTKSTGHKRAGIFEEGQPVLCGKAQGSHMDRGHKPIFSHTKQAAAKVDNG